MGDLMKLNFEGLQMEKWNIPTGIVQILDEKMRSFIKLTMFTQEDLSVALKCFSQAVNKCFLSSAERTKGAMFYILITITLEVKIIFAIF